ncbi:hypothetical protein NDR87_03085 [Nocardia sp. CDC159]|uniref:Uncharacterized protein n=1 Tax=Nocardia pulmonis TaxID=2951408 RepID=A0A9X2E0M6_9NOCA|nr:MULTISPECIES: hypothetical protein [Nocardia]MCM6772002.1 hypothetical protein [Nocardia pulmonis]MCM6785340.1 hypothetical protein [Nocardia sp. CDC159]
MIPTRANAQPGLACYARHAGETAFRATRLLALTLSGNRIHELAHFPPEHVFSRFGLPPVHPDRP